MSAPDIVGTIDLPGEPVEEVLDVRIRFEDTTMMDGPSVVIAETLMRLERGAQLPVHFRLAVPDDRLEPRRQYTLSARGRLGASSDFRDFGTVEAFPWSASTKALHRLSMKKFTRS